MFLDSSLSVAFEPGETKYFYSEVWSTAEIPSFNTEKKNDVFLGLVVFDSSFSEATLNSRCNLV